MNGIFYFQFLLSSIGPVGSGWYLLILKVFYCYFSMEQTVKCVVHMRPAGNSFPQQSTQNQQLINIP